MNNIPLKTEGLGEFCRLKKLFLLCKVEFYILEVIIVSSSFGILSVCLEYTNVDGGNTVLFPIIVSLKTCLIFF